MSNACMKTTSKTPERKNSKSRDFRLKARFSKGAVKYSKMNVK